MSASTGTLGTRPYVEIDGIPFPLVQGSQVQRSPMNPFSPASQGGQSSRITDSRLSVETWGDFTGGIGQRDEADTGSTAFAEGNLDARVPFATALPPQQNLITASGFTLADAPVFIEYMRGGPTATTLFLWSKTSTSSAVWRNNALVSRPAANVVGFAAFNLAYWYINTAGQLYKTTDAGGTWTNPSNLSAASGLTVLDNKLVAYNPTTGLFHQTLDGVTWTTFSANTISFSAPGEAVKQLFTWTNPSGNRDTIYLITNYGMYGYEDEADAWHRYYSYLELFNTTYPNAYVHRRDGNVYMAPCDNLFTNYANADKNGIVMTFNPGTADEIGPSKRFGLPEGMVDGVFRMQGGVHWLYGWAYGNTTGGGVYAYNEFQGWTQLFDARTVGTGTAKVIGGGYSSGVGWTLTNNGSIYEMPLPDRKQLPPVVNSGTYNTGLHYLRSSWTTHNQQNRWKIGAYFEIDMRNAQGTSSIPIGATVNLRYRVDSSDWVTIPLGTSAGNNTVGLLAMQSVLPGTQTWPAKVLLPVNSLQTGVPYKRIQWEVQMARTVGVITDTPVLASVSLYYTYWQENHFAYQFNVDLSIESWNDYPDMEFGGYTRTELTNALLTFNNTRKFHTFNYSDMDTEESVTAVDMLVAAREDADVGGGIYSITVRDLEAN